MKLCENTFGFSIIEQANEIRQCTGSAYAQGLKVNLLLNCADTHVCTKHPLTLSTISASGLTLEMTVIWDFPGGPVVKSLRFQCRGRGFDPWWGTKIPHAERPKTKERNDSSLPVPEGTHLWKREEGKQQIHRGCFGS